MIDLAFITGEISHDDLSLLASEDLSTQAGDLKEDMLQVKYPSSILLDVGWYPSFDLDGLFQIRVIRDYDWNDPVFFFRSHHNSFANRGTSPSAKKNQQCFRNGMRW
jgi:hypothetical protein